VKHSENDSRREKWPSVRIAVASALFLVILAGVFVPVTGQRTVTKRKRAEIQIYGLSAALGMFEFQNGYYPSSTNALNDLIVQPAGATNWHKYYDGRDDKIPLDPWGHPYLYEYPGKHETNAYDLSSAGPDGKFGTADDIANWQSSK
jgi:general secretion pathway protein G